MAENPEKNSVRRMISYVIAMVIALPLMYVLGAGPAIILSEKLPSSEKPIAVVYAPLGWVAQNTFLKKPLIAYFGFWVQVSNKI